MNDPAAAPRKFMSEHAVNLYSARWMIVTPSDLVSDGTIVEATAEVAEVCHIYLICRRPACAYDPASFKHDGKRLTGKLIYKVKGHNREVPFDIEFQLLDGATSIKLNDYPHRDFDTLNPSGECIRHLPASTVATAKARDAALRQLEVLYVGQAYADGRRSALDRLKSHSTLQKILADVVQKNPDDEILLLTFEYVPYRIISNMDGIDKAAIRDESDAKRFISILDNPLTKHQQICLVEAALIRYFNPAYNEIYKYSFPASDQKILNACYKFDFSALIVEIDTEDLSMKLYSKSIPASPHHIAKFNLIDPGIRRSFFTFIDKDGKAVDSPDVISPSR